MAYKKGETYLHLTPSLNSYVFCLRYSFAIQVILALWKYASFVCYIMRLRAQLLTLIVGYLSKYMLVKVEPNRVPYYAPLRLRSVQSYFF